MLYVYVSFFTCLYILSVYRPYAFLPEPDSGRKGVLVEIEVIICGPFTPYWKVLRSSKLHHYSPLEVLFPMVSLFAGIEVSDSGQNAWTIVRRFDKFCFRAHSSALIVPHWKELQSWNLCHSASLEMPFPMVSLPPRIKIFRLWPKTMDYSQGFWPKLRLSFGVFLLHTGRCYEAQSCTIMLPLRCSF